MTTTLLLAVTIAVAAQAPDLRSADSATRLLASLRTADPAVCELAGRNLANSWGWGWSSDAGDLPMAAPMPTPMPVPIPMPFGGATSISSPNLTGATRAGALDAAVLAVFRAALRDQSRCVRRIAARVVAREEPSWAVADFTALVKDSDPGMRETALLGLGELEYPSTISLVSTSLSDREPGVRAMAAWALGQIEDPAAIAPLGKALGVAVGGAAGFYLLFDVALNVALPTGMLGF